jgi:hypothetical protein
MRAYTVEDPFFPPYCCGSMWSSMHFHSHSQMKCSTQAFDTIGVRDIRLRYGSKVFLNDCGWADFR